MAEETETNSVELATELTVAWLTNQNNRVSPEDVPNFLRTMHATLTALSSGVDSAEGVTSSGTEYQPAVSARKSLGSKDHIISMIDGKPYRTLRRHLSTHGLSPDQYRERYNLRPDYPMVAPSYSEARRDMAKKIGLGSKGRGARAASASETPPPVKPKRAPRKAPAAD